MRAKMHVSPFSETLTEPLQSTNPYLRGLQKARVDWYVMGLQRSNIHFRERQVPVAGLSGLERPIGPIDDMAIRKS